MANPLLETKLYAPRWRPGLVARPRLKERLSRGARAKLTLISAPAGFGKTTLLAEWLTAVPADNLSAAWLSLDQRENHAASFWSYLVAALQTVKPGVGASAISLLQSPQPPPIEAVLTPLLNELSAMSTDVTLVLDDYHVIDAREIHAGMVFLLDHLPPRLHLVIASRADPPLPLARLRGRGELVEIRAEDLRFAPDEAASYFHDSMGLDLTAQDVAVLEGRTEGWIAALQLAALSMQGRSDVTGFIARFAGDDRYIVDYLVEEVLQRQPDTVRRFLRDTSILDRLSGPLCDAVMGQDAGPGVGVGKAMLEALERANLFVIPLDDRRHWYRYHHLFADVLRAHLLNEQPDYLPELHRRASGWYERNGEASEAIRHALAADDFSKAADLIELALPALRRSRQEAALLAWLGALPDALLRCRPVLSAHYGGALLTSGQLEGVEARLRAAERWLDPRREPQDTPAVPAGTPEPSLGMVVADEAEFRRLPGSIAVWRAGLALVLGHPAETEGYARRALELVPEDDLLGRGGAAALLGLATWARGDLESAHRTYAAGMQSVQRAGHVSDVISGTRFLADLRVGQGRLHEALRTYEQGLQLAAEQDPLRAPDGALREPQDPLRAPDGALREPQDEPVPRGTADLYVGLSELQCERDDLQAATQHLLTAKALGESTGFPPSRARWCVAMARVKAALGDPEGALDLLDEAERTYVPEFSPNVRPVAALKARMWVGHGRTREALGWAHAQGLSVEDDLSYVREFEHITLARVLLASRAIPDAMRLLERLLRAADDGARAGSVIEILVVQALAHATRGDIAAALVPLERALTLAEPEGYVRVFVDEGPPMAALLHAAAKRGIAPGYVQRLLTHSGTATAEPHAGQNLIEPLSERELEVLRLLATDLDGPEIASQLMVSLNTMRTHTKSIYTKLGVNSRRAALHRAEELALLSHTPAR